MSGEPRSVGELSSIVDVPVTKLYYHVKLLLKAGLVAAVDERRVGNLTETLYLATAREFRFDPQGLGFGESSDPFAASVRPFLKALGESLEDSYRQTLRTGKGLDEPGSITLRLDQASLDASRRDAFLERLSALIAEFCCEGAEGRIEAGSPRRGDDTHAYTIALAFFRSAEPSGTDTREEAGDGRY